MTAALRVFVLSVALFAATDGCRPQFEASQSQWPSRAAECSERTTPGDAFVAGWGTDNETSIQATSALNIVMVSYRSCQLQLLNECVPDVPGGWGAYNSPQWMPPVQKQFEIRDVASFRSLLPFAQPRLATLLDNGEQVHLSYVVAGIVEAIPRIPRGVDLRSRPGCAGATHYVERLVVGAYDLTASREGTSERELEVEGKRKDCERVPREENTMCRVAIRISLHPIEN